ncbi:MAG: hypothetical protein IIA60_06260, partial [Candidatus Marinimicrobia bacterium]|nr:hypothetical protein [Candidatus Neomarinimicrobiota bacterium]
MPRDSDNDVDWAGVVCHELAHCMRRDHISGLIAETLASILWWNPLAWLAKKRLIRLGEYACDDWVVAGEQPVENYARSLLNFKPQKQAAFLPGVVRSKKGVAARVHRILEDNRRNPRAGVKWALASGFVVASLSVGMTFAQTRPAEPQDETQAPTETVESTHDTATPGRSVAQSQGTLRLLMGAEGNETLSRLSPDGLKVAHGPEHGPGGIIVGDLSTGMERKYEETTLGAVFPVWSPDGKRVA